MFFSDDNLKRVKYPRLKIEEIAAKVFQPKEFDGFWVSGAILCLS
jgi:hypothetical protein